VALVRAGGREDAFELQAGDHVGMGGISVGGEYGRVEGGEPRRQDDGAHVDLMDLRLHFMADRFGQAGRDALVALGADAAGQATPDFLLYGRFVKTQLDFVKPGFPCFRFGHGHGLAGQGDGCGEIHIFHRVQRGFPAGLQVFVA
jgi:hypothetical protein